jgi:hypothetical protein
MTQIPAFLRALELRASALYLSRFIASEGWQLRRALDVEIFEGADLAKLAHFGGLAAGEN